MLEFVCGIPNWLGWTMVGFLAVLCLVTIIKLVCVIIEVWKDHREEKIFESSSL